MLSVADFEKMENIISSYEKKIDKVFQIPLSEYDERYKKVWARMEKEGLDMAFFFW